MKSLMLPQFRVAQADLSVLGGEMRVRVAELDTRLEWGCKDVI